MFPGWHDEPAYRTKAIAELKASLAIDPNRASAQEALKSAETFMAVDKVDPAPPRPEIKALDAAVDEFRNGPKRDSDEFMKVVDARIRAQADPAPYFTAAQMLIEHGQYERAHDRYVNVLSRAGGFGGAPPAVRDRAKQQWQAMYSGGEPFDTWLDKPLAAKGEERKQAALNSLLDKKLLKLKLTTLDGKPFSAASLQGKVLLLNFFASCLYSEPSARTTWISRSPPVPVTRTRHGLQQTSQSCTNGPRTSGSR